MKTFLDRLRDAGELIFEQLSAVRGWEQFFRQAVGRVSP